MRRGPKWVVAVALAVAGGCEAQPAYKTPPVDSYTAGTRQVKIGEAVNAVQGAAVTLEFFRAAEVRPFLGRFFIDGDQASSANRTTVLSHAFWTERFGSSPTIIGRTIEVDGRQAVVLGVTPPGFSFPEGTLLWTPKYSE